jgi:hypothetical protein
MNPCRGREAMAGCSRCLSATETGTDGGADHVTGRRTGREGDAVGGPVTSKRSGPRMTVAAGPPAGPPAGVLLSTKSMQLTSCDAKRCVMPGEEAAHGSDQPPTCTRQGGPQPPERRWSWRAGEAGTRYFMGTRQRSQGVQLLTGYREVERDGNRCGRGRQLFGEGTKCVLQLVARRRRPTTLWAILRSRAKTTQELCVF